MTRIILILMQGPRLPLVVNHLRLRRNEVSRILLPTFMLHHKVQHGFPLSLTVTELGTGVCGYMV